MEISGGKLLQGQQQQRCPTWRKSFTSTRHLRRAWRSRLRIGYGCEVHEVLLQLLLQLCAVLQLAGALRLEHAQDETLVFVEVPLDHLRRHHIRG